ncbi:EF-hand domain-containing protein [Gimesia benthica]|uniref:hypothetical protein n=1 Tax=Gimesia benthica TaxID=2608982 RepID=UPI00188549A6|nr:hypothetical protein [Gimesia benthica]
MSFLDRNRNGVIEPDEFDRMPGRFKEMLESAGVDTSRSMTAQEYERVMPRVMEQMRSRRGSFGGGDRGDSDDRGRSGFSRGSGGPGFGGSGFGGPPSSFSRSRGMTTMTAMIARGAALIGTPCEDATDHSNQIEVVTRVIHAATPAVHKRNPVNRYGLLWI